MRSHEQIVKDHGPSKLAHDLRARGHMLAINTPRRWLERDRIPAEYFPDIVDLGVATDEELREGLRPRKRPERRAEAA